MVYYPITTPRPHSPRFNVLLVVATQKKASGSAHDILPLQCIGDKMRIDGGVACSAAIEYENTRGLPSVYNEAIQTYGSDYDAICFLHDDLIVNDCLFFEKLEKAVQEYDLIGIAGGREYEVPFGHNPMERPLGWWQASSSLVGSVVHADGDGRCLPTVYGWSPSPVLTIDGCFIALSKKAIQSGLLFDEDFSYDFYDISLCMRAYRMGLAAGVYPILCSHMSVGMGVLQPKFMDAQRLFFQKYMRGY